jgi:hypothetical protein
LKSHPDRWKNRLGLACLEVNLEGALLVCLDRLQHASYRGGSNWQNPDSDQWISQYHLFAALGISTPGRRNRVDIVLITPQGTENVI